MTCLAFTFSSTCELAGNNNPTALACECKTVCPEHIQFCDGSASKPRGVVYPPVNLTGHTQNCLSGSTVVDVQGPPPTNCTSEEPRM